MIMLLDNVDKIESRIQNTQSIVISSVNNVEAKTLVLYMQERESITRIFIFFENACDDNDENDRDQC